MNNRRGRLEKLIHENREDNVVSPIRLSIDDQQKICSCIQNGSADELGQFFRKNFSLEKRPVLSKNPLTSEKYLFVSSVSLYTRYAIAGGLPASVAYAMSDNYILELDDIDSIEQVHVLLFEAAQGFAHEVEQYSLYRRYSRHVVKVLRYMDEHLYEPIHIRDLAVLTGLSESYLSSRFRAETGMTVFRYLEKQKMQAARTMLLESDLSVSAISSRLGYCSESYFIQRFVRSEGITPGHFRTMMLAEVPQINQ